MQFHFLRARDIRRGPHRWAGGVAVGMILAVQGCASTSTSVASPAQTPAAPFVMSLVIDGDDGAPATLTEDARITLHDDPDKKHAGWIVGDEIRLLDGTQLATVGAMGGRNGIGRFGPSDELLTNTGERLTVSDDGALSVERTRGPDVKGKFLNFVPPRRRAALLLAWARVIWTPMKFSQP